MRYVSGTPIVVTEADGVGLTTPEPYVRHVKVLLSPMLQEGLEDFAVGTCEVPPREKGSLHTHPDAAEIWMFSEGHGRAVIGEEEIVTGPGTVVYTPPASATSPSTPGTRPSSSSGCTAHQAPSGT